MTKEKNEQLEKELKLAKETQVGFLIGFSYSFSAWLRVP